MQNDVEYQLTPPHIHRQNAAERAILTFKNHFTAGLCSTDKAFPMNCWDLLLPQATMPLNLLRNSIVFPKLSAYAVLEGKHDYNSHLLAPPGTKKNYTRKRGSEERGLHMENVVFT